MKNAGSSCGSVQRGFTLIELMVTVAIIGILVAIALPSYSAYVKKGNRASARAALLESQQFMERFYAANDAYDFVKGTTTAVALPGRLRSAPPENPKYTLSVDASAGNGYTLTADPIQADDGCGNLTLTNTGVKGRTGTVLSVADCWK